MRMIGEKVSRRALWAIFGCRWRSGPPTSDMTSDWVVINVVSVVGHVMSLGVKMTTNMVGMMLMMDSEWVRWMVGRWCVMLWAKVRNICPPSVHTWVTFASG